jgi:hypothetical protein
MRFKSEEATGLYRRWVRRVRARRPGIYRREIKS